MAVRPTMLFSGPSFGSDLGCRNSGMALKCSFKVRSTPSNEFFDAAKREEMYVGRLKKLGTHYYNSTTHRSSIPELTTTN